MPQPAVRPPAHQPNWIQTLASLSDREVAILQSEMARLDRPMGTTYLFLIFLGGVGAHRFYLDEPRQGAWMIVLFLLSWIPFLGFFPACGLFVWWVVDLFTLPQKLKQRSARLQAGIIAELRAGQPQLERQQIPDRFAPRP